MTDEIDPLTIEEFTELLAEELDEDPEEIRRQSEEFEIQPPWEAVWEGRWDAPDYEEMTRDQLIELHRIRDEIEEAAERMRDD